MWAKIPIYFTEHSYDLILKPYNKISVRHACTQHELYKMQLKPALFAKLHIFRQSISLPFIRKFLYHPYGNHGLPFNHNPRGHTCAGISKKGFLGQNNIIYDTLNMRTALCKPVRMFFYDYMGVQKTCTLKPRHVLYLKTSQNVGQHKNIPDSPGRPFGFSIF